MADNLAHHEYTPHPCPLDAMLNAAEKVVERVGDAHQQPAISKGALELSRISLEELRKEWPYCKEAVVDSEGQIACGIWTLFRATRGTAAEAWNGHMVDFTKIHKDDPVSNSNNSTNGKDSHNTGQYL